MAIQLDGFIKASNINVELGYPSTQLLSFNSTNVRGLLGFEVNTPISLSDFYGASSIVDVTVTISANTLNYVFNPAAVPNYAAGKTQATLVIPSGVVVGASSTGNVALSITGFAAGDTVTIVNAGYIVGAGGAGGAGNGNGGAGGTAMWTDFPCSVSNTGVIAGGGGGGCGGIVTSYNCTSDPRTPSTCYYMAGGGGGGAGYTAGAGGGGTGGNSLAGSAGSLTTGGAGGRYNSGNGGTLGVAGQTRSRTGGAAGYYISGNSYVTWTTAGTRLGSVY